MIHLPLVETATNPTPITAITATAFAAWRDAQPEKLNAWLTANDFKADSGSVCLFPALDGALGGVVAGLGDGTDRWSAGRLARTLPKGTYALQEIIGIDDEERGSATSWFALAWALGSYRFERYKSETDPAPSSLVFPDDADRGYVEGAANAAVLTRDLINTPAEDMSPEALTNAAQDLAAAHGAAVATIVGEDLLTANFPAIHAVGRAAEFAPRLIDLTWGDAKAPKVTLVGKGCALTAAA